MLMPGESTSIKVNPNQCIYNLSFRYINGSFGGFRVNTCQSSVLNVVGNGGTSWSHGQGRERDYIPGPQILMPDSGLSNGIFSLGKSLLSVLVFRENNMNIIKLFNI